MDKAASDPLQVIRGRIDAIDAEMHRLLMARSEVIAELIEVKGTSKPGAAFRPEREADMMRRLVLRHDGTLPIVTVEHIWREIITTFTGMQAPFGIAAGPAADPLEMRDVIRFYFGFSIPVVDYASAADAVARVSASGKEIAIVAEETEGRWWGALTDPGAPKIFAKLPFIELPGRPAALPAYVVGPPLRGQAAPDIRLFAVPDAEGHEPAIHSHGGRVAGRAGADALVELPAAATLDDIARESGRPLKAAREVGGFAQPIRFVAKHSA